MSGCGCHACDEGRRKNLPIGEALQRFMIICPECGNKRCPRANHHDNPCTGSNEPGQPGSAYS